MRLQPNFQDRRRFSKYRINPTSKPGGTVRRKNRRTGGRAIRKTSMIATVKSKPIQPFTGILSMPGPWRFSGAGKIVHSSKEG
jgi:hypothetical protein